MRTCREIKSLSKQFITKKLNVLALLLLLAASGVCIAASSRIRQEGLTIRPLGNDRAEIIIEGKKGAKIVIRIKTKFDPATLSLQAYCCDEAMQNCRLRAAGQNCADPDKPITVWQ